MHFVGMFGSKQKKILLFYLRWFSLNYLQVTEKSKRKLLKGNNFRFFS